MGGGLPNQMGGGWNARRNGRPQHRTPTVKNNSRNLGATLAPNEAQYPIAQGPSGMKCPTVTQFNQQYNCTLHSTFRRPHRGSRSRPRSRPRARRRRRRRTASSDDDSDDSDASPTPTPAGRNDDAAGRAAAQRRSDDDQPEPAASCTSRRSSRFACRATWTSCSTAAPRYSTSFRRFNIPDASLRCSSSMKPPSAGSASINYIGSYAKFTTPQSNTVQFAFTLPRASACGTRRSGC